MTSLWSSQEASLHINDMKEVLIRSRQYDLWTNPLKCAFVVSSRKLFRFTIHKKGIYLDLAKDKAIRDMEHTSKKLKSFMRRVSYIQWLISALAKLLEPFHKLLQKNELFKWNKEQQIAFQKVKDVLSSLLTMFSPVNGFPLTLDLTSTDKSIDALLA